MKDAAIKKQEAALYYYEQMDYQKAKRLCDEALDAWGKLRKSKIKNIRDEAIDHHIDRCNKILRKIKN